VDNEKAYLYKLQIGIFIVERVKTEET
jgi:hypothetical protein